MGYTDVEYPVLANDKAKSHNGLDEQLRINTPGYLNHVREKQDTQLVHMHIACRVRTCIYGRVAARSVIPFEIGFRY